MNFDKYNNTMELPMRNNFQTAEEYMDARKAYHAHTNELKMQFKQDMLDDFGVTDHPKAQKLWELAWERGHSAGLYAVYQEAEELVELLR